MYDFERLPKLCNEEKRMIEALASINYISSSYAKVGKSRNKKSRTETLAIKRQELSDSLSKLQNEIETLREALLEDIEKLEPGLIRLIAKLHYGYGISIRQIAETTDYEEDYVFRERKKTAVLLIRLEEERKRAMPGIMPKIAWKSLQLESKSPEE